MAHGSASAARPAAPAWHRLALPTDRRRALWASSRDRTGWRACGWDWDAVAVTPIAVGLDALAAMHLGTASGHPVLADRIRDVLYILVPPGTGGAAAGLPGVRVLSRGSQLLFPETEHGTAVTHWISPPRPSPRLVRTDRLAAHLRALTGAAHEEAAAS